MVLSDRAQRTVDASESIDLSKIVGTVLQILAERIEETEASVVVIDQLPVVLGDRRWLIQALQNLVANALKFALPDEAPNIEIATATSTELAGDEAGIVIRDRGPGVDVEHAERIFDLFLSLITSPIPRDRTRHRMPSSA